MGRKQGWKTESRETGELEDYEASIIGGTTSP